MTVISFLIGYKIIQSSVKKSSHSVLQGFKAIYCGRRVQKHYICVNFIAFSILE